MFGIFGTKEADELTAPGDVLTSRLSRPNREFADLEDLPCPWCHAQTSDSDAACPSCGRNFGARELRT